MVYFWFSTGNAYSNGTISYIQVQKAVHKQPELWQISPFAHVNKKSHSCLGHSLPRYGAARSAAAAARSGHRLPSVCGTVTHGAAPCCVWFQCQSQTIPFWISCYSFCYLRWEFSIRASVDINPAEALCLDPAPESRRPQFSLRPYARFKICMNFVLASHTKVNFNCSSEKNYRAIARWRRETLKKWQTRSPCVHHYKLLMCNCRFLPS